LIAKLRCVLARRSAEKPGTSREQETSRGLNFKIALGKSLGLCALTRAAAFAQGCDAA
jgi:hypothetical protein